MELSFGSELVRLSVLWTTSLAVMKLVNVLGCAVGWFTLLTSAQGEECVASTEEGFDYEVSYLPTMV